MPQYEISNRGLMRTMSAMSDPAFRADPSQNRTAIESRGTRHNAAPEVRGGRSPFTHHTRRCGCLAPIEVFFLIREAHLRCADVICASHMGPPRSGPAADVTPAISAEDLVPTPFVGTPNPDAPSEPSSRRNGP